MRWTTSLARAALIVLGISACSSSAPDAGPRLDPRVRPAKDTWWDGMFPERCAGVSAGEELALCAERAFWQAFQFDVTKRHEVCDLLRELAERAEATGALRGSALAKLYWRRAQLATALGAEQGDTKPYATVLADLDKAATLAPESIEIGFWRWFTRMFLGYVASDMAMYEEAKEAFWSLLRKDPNYGVFFAMTIAALPLETGQPQRVAEEVLAFDCATRNWCEKESDWVPFQQAGAALAFAEVFLRLGDRERAITYLERALTAPRAEKWPLRAQAQGLRSDIDGELAKYAARGEQGFVLDLMKTGTSAGCVACHGPAR